MRLDKSKLKAGFENFLDTKIGRLTSKHKMLIGAAAWLIPCVAFFFLVYTPRAEEMERLESRKSSVAQELRKVEASARELDKHKAEMQEVEQQFQMASQLLPEEKEIPSLLTNISAQGITSGLEFLSFKPLTERPQVFYAEIPVDIGIYGPYHNVGLFLDKISKLPRIVTVNNIKMGSPQMSAGEMMLNTTFQLVTYRFIEPVVEEKKDPRRKR
jgi:type IV pilus assembly protein PilO